MTELTPTVVTMVIIEAAVEVEAMGEALTMAGGLGEATRPRPTRARISCF